MILPGCLKNVNYIALVSVVKFKINKASSVEHVERGRLKIYPV